MRFRVRLLGLGLGCKGRGGKQQQLVGCDGEG